MVALEKDGASVGILGGLRTGGGQESSILHMDEDAVSSAVDAAFAFLRTQDSMKS